mmetsp:Transcript_13423/g.39363  ORF Transcript_13423/g.39363 Transcript_13423/m.39363 type:complete len:286 (+) Transcript_13423:74-931(+)
MYRVVVPGSSGTSESRRVVLPHARCPRARSSPTLDVLAEPFAMEIRRHDDGRVGRRHRPHRRRVEHEQVRGARLAVEHHREHDAVVLRRRPGARHKHWLARIVRCAVPRDTPRGGRLGGGGGGRAKVGRLCGGGAAQVDLDDSTHVCGRRVGRADAVHEPVGRAVPPVVEAGHLDMQLLAASGLAAGGGGGQRPLVVRHGRLRVGLDLERPPPRPRDCGLAGTPVAPAALPHAPRGSGARLLHVERVAPDRRPQRLGQSSPPRDLWRSRVIAGDLWRSRVISAAP